jgi:UMF1 family MFS transporter
MLFLNSKIACAKGFMFGYAGSLILLGFNLTMVMMPEWYGISDGSLPAVFLLSVGIWWIGFAQITLSPSQ